jgi:hypothetical protein
MTQSNQENQAAYRRLQPTIDRAYPRGRFLAIHGQRVVADAATLGELLAALAAREINPHEALAVQAGVEYPEFVSILLSGVRP